MKRKKIVVYEKLSKEDIKTYEKNHPGYRLAFSCRYPNLPLYMSGVSVLSAVIALLISIIRIVL